MIQELRAGSIIFALAFAIAAATLPLAIVIGRKLGMVAQPAALPEGSKPAVELGGAPIVGAILVALLILHQLPIWLLAGVAGMLVLGIIDDKINLSPPRKFFGQFVICAFAFACAMPVPAMTPWHWLDYAIALGWLLTTTNAFNLIDGLDGLAAGIGIIAAATVAATGLMHHAPPVWVPGIAVAGALVGFLIYNLSPAWIIMGDGGALPLGYLLGALALLAGRAATNSRLTPYVFPVMVLIVPLLDTAIVSVTRLATGSWISRHGSENSHYRLVSLGLSDRAVVALCCAVAAVGAICGFSATVMTHENAIVALPFLILAPAVLALFMMDLTFESNPPGLAYEHARGVSRMILRIGYKQRIAEAAIDFTLISGAYLAAQALRYDFSLSSAQTGVILREVPYVALVTYPAFILAGVYRSIWRFMSLSDGLRFAFGAVLAGVFVVAAREVTPIGVSGSIVVLYVILLFDLLVMTRISFQAIRRGINRLVGANARVVVIGAGQQAAAAANFIFNTRRQTARVLGFVDDDAFAVGKLIYGRRVLGTCSDLERIHRDSPFDELLVAADGLPLPQLQQISTFAERNRVTLSRFSIEVNALAQSPDTAASDAAPRSHSLRPIDPFVVRAR